MGVQAGIGKPLASSPLPRLTVQVLHFKGNAFALSLCTANAGATQ
jgi:hypothetical protein